jgi:hypothetical protein
MRFSLAIVLAIYLVSKFFDAWVSKIVALCM